MMTTLKFAVYLTCLFLAKTTHMTNLKLATYVHQVSGFYLVNVGTSVTLHCFYEYDALLLYWYKQPLGQKPRVISTFYKYEKNGTFHDELKNNPRFTLRTTTGQYHLTISDLHISDSATYYCACSDGNHFEFLEGTTVSVEALSLNVKALVHPSSSESVRPGDSVTLNCTVHTGTCDGEHSVYWFKKSEDPQPGVIYTHGGKNDLCERKPDTQTHTCVYNLPVQSVDRSHDGIYYCAVASCGHVLFGNGTKLDSESEADSQILVIFLSVALTFNTILVGLLAYATYKMNNRHKCECTDSHARSSNTSAPSAESYQGADNLHYAALTEKRVSRLSRVRDDTWTECVYTSVRH